MRVEILKSSLMKKCAKGTWFDDLMSAFDDTVIY
jgi:hypothetical protein